SKHFREAPDLSAFFIPSSSLPALVFLPAPVKLSVVSKNFYPKLQWDPGPGTPAGTRYSISKRKCEDSEGGQNRPKSTLIPTLRVGLQDESAALLCCFCVCGLTVLFSSHPAVVGPPKLAVAGCGTCLWVNISLPEADRHSGAGDIQKFYGAVFKIFWRKGQQGKVEVRGRQHRRSDCAADVSSVVAPLVFLFTLSLIVSGVLLYTGFLCKLRVTKPSALMVRWSSFHLKWDGTLETGTQRWSAKE
uniref:Fibronectin type-III domain-containing protein n=1 Tax=Oryzias latipes TaxID=8090 RepID=A0A3P9ITY7_ORYLA